MLLFSVFLPLLYLPVTFTTGIACSQHISIKILYKVSCNILSDQGVKKISKNHSRLIRCLKMSIAFIYEGWFFLTPMFLSLVIISTVWGRGMWKDLLHFVLYISGQWVNFGSLFLVSISWYKREDRVFHNSENQMNDEGLADSRIVFCFKIPIQSCRGIQGGEVR